MISEVEVGFAVYFGVAAILAAIQWGRLAMRVRRLREENTLLRAKIDAWLAADGPLPGDKDGE